MAAPEIGIIGGSGFSFFNLIEGTRQERVDTPYGPPSSALTTGRIGEENVAVVLRHGEGHSILPHAVNYRANLWALKRAGVDTVIALATVGGIGRECRPGAIVIPDQILDFTHSREHTFSPLDGKLFHIDFTEPYCGQLRRVMIEGAERLNIAVIPSGTYAATQGPRFETAAEIRKFENDGAHIVGMTGMPEAALAREAGMCYASIALVVNYAAGRSGNRISVEEIREAYGRTTQKVYSLVAGVVAALAGFECSVPPAITP
jgi:5'-deoxy-5'-methylthioadenosine phosphorylase